MALGIFKIALHVRDQHVLMSQSVKVLNFFNILTLKQISGKRKPFSKSWSTVFWLKLLRLKTSFPFKSACQKPMLT